MAIPWLREGPYLVKPGRGAELRESLERAGFLVVEAASGAGDPERGLLEDLTRKLGLREAGAGNWAAYSDRLWDFLSGSESQPCAVVITGLDKVEEHDTRVFVKCIHNLLTMPYGIVRNDPTANRQIEYFFLGEWKP